MKSPSVTSSVKGDIVDSSRSTTTTRHGPKSWNPQLKVSAQVPLPQRHPNKFVKSLELQMKGCTSE
jgi:hypothetical protein